MLKGLVIGTVIASTLFSCGCPAPQECEKINVVDAHVQHYYDEFHSGSLVDENGEVWAFEKTELHEESSYKIVYGEDWVVIALVENGEVTTF